MGQLQKFTKLLLKQSQSNFGYVSIPKDPNIVLNYEKAKYCDVTFRDKSGLDEQISRSAFVSCLLTFLLTDFQLFVYNLNFRAKFEFLSF